MVMRLEHANYPDEEESEYLRIFNRHKNLINALIYVISDAIGIILSALYGKILVVLGIGFPMSEVISTYIPAAFYDVNSLQCK